MHQLSLSLSSFAYFFLMKVMSQNSMATLSSSSSPIFHNFKRLDLESIRALVISVNQHILEFLTDPETHKSLQLKCISRLAIQKQKFFEFSEHSIISNLYWGIKSVEAAIQAKSSEERNSHLKSSEQMLQVPALLTDHGSTGGIPNCFLISSSYFYLSLVRKLQGDEWQVTMHFLQALLVSPQLIRTEFAPDIWRSIFLSQIKLADFCEDSVDEATRQLARRYKDWLMYYQVMLYGETPQWHFGTEVAPPLDEKSPSFMYGKSTGNKCLESVEHGDTWPVFQNYEKVHPLDIQENIIDEIEGRAKPSVVSPERTSILVQEESKALLTELDEFYHGNINGSLRIKCIQDMLMESQSPISIYSCNDSAGDTDSEAKMDEVDSSTRIPTINVDDPPPEISDWKLQAPWQASNSKCSDITTPVALGHMMHKKSNELNTSYSYPSRFPSSVSDLNLSILELREIDLHALHNCHVEERTTLRGSQRHDFNLLDHISSPILHKYSFTQTDHREGSAKERLKSNSQKSASEVSLHPEREKYVEILEIFETAISTPCLSEGVGKCEDDDSKDLSTRWIMLNNKKEAQYGHLKDVILDQLLSAISTSKEERIIRASVCMISAMISENPSVIEDVKKKGLRLDDLASVLKKIVHEAAILIYMINPSPAEIKALKLLPALLEVVCSSNEYKGEAASLLITPSAASLKMIEVLLTAFDHATNNMHLAAISSSQILSRLMTVARNNNLEEFISLAAILVKCMQFDGKCRMFLSQCTPMDPFIRLLTSKEKHAKFTALEFFHEILRIPRSSATSLLHQIRQVGSINIMHILIACIQHSQPEYRLLAANLLLQLDMLENSHGISIFREEALEVLLEAVASEESSATQTLSAFILSNLGGTYAWTGEPYTVAWLLKRAGLTSLHQRNWIRNMDWLDQSLQDSSIDAWCSTCAKSIIKIGNPVFHALEKGLQSKIKSVSRNCLIAIAWLGCEIAMSPSNFRYSACEILLSGIEKFLHPGLELEERLLACLCVYSYTSGRDRQKLIDFSEGQRESLRRLSSISWMAEELLKVTDYFLPINSHISCVHTQILEMGHNCSGAVTALIYYKGQLYSGYSDGSIKVWDIRGQTAALVCNFREHKKAVTCFTLSEPGGSLLTGSADKTVRVWQMVRRKLECVEVIETKEPIHKIDTYGQMIFVITQSRGIKVFDASRIVKVICRTKYVKCMAVVQGKIYVGCMDSSIQEVDVKNEREQEIREPTKNWRMQTRPVNSVLTYKGWLYCASTIVEGLDLKEWRRHNEPQLSITMGRGTNVQAMGVVEDFIYLNCSSSPSILQIWLRGTQQKVGRLSAGSKVTSLLTANDIVLCGTETGLIKGWIPL